MAGRDRQKSGNTGISGNTGRHGESILTPMTTAFPGFLDSFPNPGSTTNQDDPGLLHHVQHSNENDAIAAIEAKLGVSLSSVTTSMDYVVNLLLMTQTQQAGGGYREIVGQPFPTLVTWYTNAGKTIKLVEKSYAYDPNQNPITITFRLYVGSVANTVLRTVTDTVTYSGPFEASRTRSVI